MKIIQRERVLQYIKEYGSIDRARAAAEIGCHELSSRIGELESKGYKFKRTNKNGRNRYGDKVRWIEYSLAD